jgi:hypothetical protein
MRLKKASFVGKLIILEQVKETKMMTPFSKENIIFLNFT